MKLIKLNSVSINYLIITLLWMSVASKWHCCSSSTPTPTPTPWPEQFHALLYMNLSTTRLQLSDLWYDWPKGRNVNIFQKQLGELLYDIEWNNGTSFYYTLGGTNATCEVMEFEVGIPRPDFLDGAVYLGTQVTDGFLCNVWEKVDFIWYYEDVVSNRPVRWDFYDASIAAAFNGDELLLHRDRAIRLLHSSSSKTPTSAPQSQLRIGDEVPHRDRASASSTAPISGISPTFCSNRN